MTDLFTLWSTDEAVLYECLLLFTVYLTVNRIPYLIYVVDAQIEFRFIISTPL